MANTRKIDLLIVDDDDDIRLRAQQFFEQQQFRVMAAESGEKALEIVKQRAFDVAILDLAMPGIDGLETLKQLREGNDPLEVIMLTRHGTIEAAVQAMKQGAHDFLTKPVRFKHRVDAH